MPTQQYDTIQPSYDEWRKSSLALVERDQIHRTLLPLIPNARVLDLACGSGFYTHHLLAWGAASVVAVDISSAMLDQASRLTPPQHKSQVKFMEHDCSKAELIDGGDFDIVLGAWFLNYSATAAQMAEMWKLIALNLRDGGTFIGITLPPTADPAAFIAAERALRPPPRGSGGLICSVTGEVEDGVAIHVYADTKAGEVNFDCWHLRKDVYEEAARKGGMGAALEWRAMEVGDEVLAREGDGKGGRKGREELESYRLVPHYGMLVVRK